MVMTCEKHIKVINKWTPEEIEYLKASYGTRPNKEIYAGLPRHPPNIVKLKANSFGLKDVRYWRQDDLEYLKEKYGLESDEAIGEYLHRSKNALHIQAVRKLHICHKSNFYTAREVSDLLGVACSKTIIDWMERGWIEGQKSPVRCGGGLMWNFTYESIVKFVTGHPWMVRLSKMKAQNKCPRCGGTFYKDDAEVICINCGYVSEPTEVSRLVAIVKNEFQKDPWYSIYKTCQLIGVVYNSAAMSHYIKLKWLHPIKKPIEGGNHWTYLFFKSDIDRFLADDPRRLHPLRLGESKRRKHFKEGRAVKVLSIFRLKCPKCNKTVRIKTRAVRLEAPAVRRLFIEKYNQSGTCLHGRLCQVEKVLKPYKKHKSSKEVNNGINSEIQLSRRIFGGGKEESPAGQGSQTHHPIHG